MTTPRPVAVITDGEQRSALAIVRSLGRTDYRVIVTSATGRSIAGASRFAAAEHRVPDPLRVPARFVDALTALCEAEQASLLLPVSEPSMLAILAERARFAAAIPFPPLPTFRRISDKKQLLAAAAQLGIPTPAQTVVESAEQVPAISESLQYPVVVKPARSVGEADGRRAKFGVTYAESSRALRELGGSLDRAAYPLLLQQRIVGPGVGIFLLLWAGREYARFAHRRLREKPPSGGVSVYRESIYPDEQLVRLSRALLDHFAWSGVAMVEFKIDQATGTPFLMEVNGRFWGSLQLAVDAGVDFPLLTAQLARGDTPAPVQTFRYGVKSRWWWGDVDHVLARLLKPDRALSLPPGSHGRLRTLAEFFRWRRDDRNEVFRLGDPLPFARETIQWIRALAP